MMHLWGRLAGDGRASEANNKIHNQFMYCIAVSFESILAPQQFQKSRPRLAPNVQPEVPPCRNLVVQPPADGVRLITLHRPQALNALSTELLAELAAELDAAERDEQTRAVVITGSRKAFAAGADINEMAERDLVGILNDPRVATGNASPPSPNR
jgi:hypothetical protein